MNGSIDAKQMLAFCRLEETALALGTAPPAQDNQTY